MLTVVGTNVRFKRDHDGNQVSSDKGQTWHFTFRGETEFRELWRNHEIIGHIPHDTDEQDDELEIIGNTLDEPIPDDFIDMIL